ncbi:MAG: homoserine dehydrogenase [Lachnospiraceae bacterium]|jgi:homoserine dehydrogenase|nr:homoserine dehydrogenase [Lachnospiraceae bacterium]
MIQIAVIGYGTVGSGVVEVIGKNTQEINKKAAEEVYVKYILDLRDFPGDPYEDRVVHDIDILLNDPEIKIICETMGGIRPAYDFTKQALSRGISVCTSNKELVASHGPELLRIAREHNCNYLFEASVGGGIPIIRPLNYSLTAEKIDSIVGILNGTTNFILSKMETDGADFGTVLKEAQEKGYAERNPEADVEGYDACRKIAILSSLMTGKNVRFEDIYTEGITGITAADFKYAAAMGMTIKLLAIGTMVPDADPVSKEGEKLYACVAPFMIDQNHPLYFVHDVFNAVYVHGNMLGDSMYYGRGAGKLPTASAVVADVVDCARHIGKTIMCFWDSENMEVAPMDDRVGRFFVRVAAAEAGQVKSLFGSVTEVEAMEDSEFAFICGPLSEAEFATKVEAFTQPVKRIRLA